jgi:hypothetical protein
MPGRNGQQREARSPLQLDNSGAVMSMTISTLNASAVVSFFENGQLNLTELFTLEDLNREQVDILRNFQGRLH